MPERAKLPILEALGVLTKKERQAVELVIFQEMSQAEAGARLGISKSTMSELFSRAIVRLRAALNVRTAQAV